ncbi:MAG: hypothetical protein NBV68_07670 [Erythrobacter sp.]|uniref:hypothetical protein n=1 Tax=Erythrobacter sp. TaxID=1042 RepID=UPI0025FF7569|nr:hypothetical protein [Erythrobacter sp.]MCL9999244.1 hypothetical protein [Erythrobacter sp.]
MSGQRLRLTTSRPAGYRRGGQVIGGAAAPTLVAVGDVTPEQLLALLTDPNIAIDVENKEGEFKRAADEERLGMAQLLREELAKEQLAALGEPVPSPTPPAAQGSEPNTAEPQGEGLTPGAEASQAGGPDATADGSDASAGDAANPEPTAPELAPAPEPAAEPKPASKGRGRAKGNPA